MCKDLTYDCDIDLSRGNLNFWRNIPTSVLNLVNFSSAVFELLWRQNM